MTSAGSSSAAPRPAIRVLLVDDSPLGLRLLQRGLAGFDDLVVVGTALDGREALAAVERLRPDVICTDLHMPVLDGLGLVRRVMTERPTPIVVVSAALGDALHQGRDNVFELLKAGAVEVSPKPRGGFEAQVSADFVDLARRLRVAAGVSVFRRVPGPTRKGSRSAKTAAEAGAAEVTPRVRAPSPGLVVIGASTGGPSALQQVLGALPASLPVPLVVVQHIAPGFLAGLARWLDASVALTVEVARDRGPMAPGRCYLAPSSHHLRLATGDRFRLDDGPPSDEGHRPSVDALFESAAARFGSRTLAVLLTGMGRDGARGMQAVAEAGGGTIAQDRASCVVFGMPAAAIALGHVQRTLPLAEIGPAIVADCGERGAGRPGVFGAFAS